MAQRDSQRSEMPDTDWIVNRRPHAQKEHHCDCCGGPIHVGEQHFYGAYQEDGAFVTTRQHIRRCYQD